MANLYVKTDGNDSNNGTSWDLAVKHIYKAIDLASSGDTIIIRAGTYDDEGFDKLINKSLIIKSEENDYTSVIIKCTATGGTAFWKIDSSYTLEIYDLTIELNANGQTHSSIFGRANGTTKAIRLFLKQTGSDNTHGKIDDAYGYGNSTLYLYKCTTRRFWRAIESLNYSYFKDCIFENFGDTGEIFQSTPTEIDYVCTYNVATSKNLGSNSLKDTNPQFVSSDSAEIESTSSCIDAGITIAGYVEDYYGTAPDIGCYEYPPAISVQTNSATNIAGTTATLNGNLTNLGSENEVQVWFEYWEDISGATVYETTKETKSLTGTFSANISGLTEGTTYIFKAVAQGTSSGATEKYGDELNFTTIFEVSIDESLTLNDSFSSDTTHSVSELIDETLNLSDNFEISELLTQEINETLNLSDSFNYKLNLNLDETLNITDDIDAHIPFTRVGSISYPSKVIHTNPLIVVSYTDPIKIAKLDITSTEEPQWVVYTLDDSTEDFKNAVDVVVNETFDKVYVACANGKIVKLDLGNFNNREEINVSDTDNLITIDSVDDLNIIFAGTDYSTSEMYKIDEANVVKINTRFDYVKTYYKKIKTFFNSIFTKIINTDFRYVITNYLKINTDFRYTKYDFNNITPISTTDFSVFIDGTELGVGDIVLNSINVMWNIEEPSTASFILARYHDKPNYTLDNTYSQITNNNAVVIKIQGREIFTGKIENVDCSGESERITVNCKGTIRSVDYTLKDLPLCGVNETRNLYHIINNNVIINKPVNDYDNSDKENSTTIYKGIRVDLGTSEREHYVRYWTAYTHSIDIDNFIPNQNFTYYWFASAENFLTGYSFDDLKYIGTSLSPLSDDMWYIKFISYHAQRQWDNITEELGYYYVGDPPYKEISCKNGRYISHWHWEDRDDGLYSILHECWDWVDYAKQVAHVEYELLKNANDEIAQYTSANITMTIDALLYYNLKLLNKINITNTTETDIYKNNNGFPLRIKSININSNSMNITVTLDNKQTDSEKEDLKKYIYPAEPEKQAEIVRKTYRKFDTGFLEYIE